MLRSDLQDGVFLKGLDITIERTGWKPLAYCPWARTTTS